MNLNSAKLFIFFCASLILMTSCSNLFYYPTRNLYVEPNKLDPVPSVEIFINYNGITIYGWQFKAQNNKDKSCLLYFHGNGQNRSSHFYSLYWLVKKGINLFIFDYPGYGQTAGAPTPESTVKTAVDAIKYVKNKECEKFYIYGHSLGGQIAMRATWELKDEITPDILFVDSTFLSYQEIGRETLAKSFLTWLFQPLAYVILSDQWAMEDRIKDFKTLPIVVVHTKNDYIIPFKLGQQIYDSIQSNQKEFWIKEKGDHNNVYGLPDGLELRRKLTKKLNR